MMLSNAHTHTLFADGKNSVGEMAEKAVSLGFVSLGFSEHAKQDFDRQYSLDEEREAAYKNAVRAEKEKRAGQIRIHLGMERDQFSVADREGFDYVIGSVHYLDTPHGKIPVDGNREGLYKVVRTLFHGDGLAFAEAYFENLAAYVTGWQPDIIGHADLLNKYNRENEIFDQQCPAYRRCACSALDRMIRGCDLMEINTGAMARSGAKAPYPALPLLAHWRRLGGRIIINSDCHNLNFLTIGYDAAVALAKEAGFSSQWILSPCEGPLLIEIPF